MVEVWILWPDDVYARRFTLGRVPCVGEKLVGYQDDNYVVTDVTWNLKDRRVVVAVAVKPRS